MAGEILSFGANCSAEFALLGHREKSVLVAGGAGFLGSHICARLIAAGRRVICVDNLMTGSLRNVSELANDSLFCFHLHDVIHPLAIGEPIGEIYNLACPASPEKYQRDPLHTFQTSVRGAENLLMLAQTKGARILQASTSEVYGDPDISPQPESYRGAVNTFGPRACYDEGKRAAEMLFYEYSAHGGVEARVARIFNTYGPQMAYDDGRVVSNFIVQALMGRPITVYGDGSQTRSFCYVDDMVDGLMALMESPPDCQGPMNLGNPVEFSVLELAQKVLAKTGSRSQIVRRPLPTDDPRQRRPDISRAHEKLGFAPKIALDEGLDATIAHFSRVLGNVGEPIKQVV